MANFLYNGVELPDINTVWTDKTAYPYAIITSFDAALVGYSGVVRYIFLMQAEWHIITTMEFVIRTRLTYRAAGSVAMTPTFVLI